MKSISKDLMPERALTTFIQTLLAELKTDASQGLSSAEAASRLAADGANALPEVPPDGPLRIFFRQFTSPLIYLLVGAALVLFALGEVHDTAIILFILVFNACVGAVQEGRSQSALRALKNFAETSATVLRDGEELVVPDAEVVRGDILYLREGEKVPADARILSAANLTVDEAALTGESAPVHKMEALDDETSSRETTALYKGTHVVLGHGVAVVTATGSATRIGGVARDIKGVDTEIPLAADIRKLSNILFAVVGVLSIVLFGIGVAAGESIRQMLAVVVSLSVSVIPEGLPIVVTLILAAGVVRMSRRHALVKRLQAVEALGEAHVIAVDKTGTLTKNEMTVEKVYVGNAHITISGAGYAPEGTAMHNDRPVAISAFPGLAFLARIATFGADARVIFSKETKQWSVAGDPTDGALVVFAKKLGLHKENLDREAPLLAEMPFDYRVKFHATLRSAESGNVLSVIGAPEAVLPLATAVWQDGAAKPLTKGERMQLEEVQQAFSAEGLRVIALAAAEGVSSLGDGHMPELLFIGFAAMKDALRAEAPAAVERAEAAGIRVVMITGDNAVTASAVAKEAGILREGDRVITGAEIDAMTDPDLVKSLDGVSVFARVTPEHKMRIVQAFRARGLVTAMTGDGVNDAPSLVAADLGVAMGVIGTEVAKEAADIVLLNDDFGSIVSAVEEGRSIYRTIRKVILYLFSTSIAEVLVIMGALTAGLPLILQPAQIIWLNFVTDGFLTLAIGVEPKDRDLLSRSFSRRARMLVDAASLRRMAVMAIPMATSALVAFFIALDDGMAKANTMALTALAAAQWFNAWNVRSERNSVFAESPLRNPWLLAATALVVGLQLIAVHAPFMQGVLGTVALSPLEWAIAIAAGTLVLLVEEVRKTVLRVRAL